MCSCPRVSTCAPARARRRRRRRRRRLLVETRPAPPFPRMHPSSACAYLHGSRSRGRLLPPSGVGLPSLDLRLLLLLVGPSRHVRRVLVFVRVCALDRSYAARTVLSLDSVPSTNKTTMGQELLLLLLLPLLLERPASVQSSTNQRFCLDFIVLVVLITCTPQSVYCNLKKPTNKFKVPKVPLVLRPRPKAWQLGWRPA